MARQLNAAGSRNAAARIAAGDVNNGAWDFTAEDGNKLLGADGKDWAAYSRWFLAVNTDQPEESRGRYSYPFGKGGQVYVAGLRAIRARASQQNDSAIYDRAGALLDAANGGKGIKQMPMPMADETQTDFTARCLADDTMMANHSNSAERAAMCIALWEDAEEAGEAEGMPAKAGVPGCDMTQMSAGAMRRAYSILEVKGLDEEQRIVRGVATTPSADRIGDIVEPLGVQFKNPMPCLWMHDSSKPIGLVTFDKPTRNGIKFEAKLPKVLEPGTLKDRVDEAWQTVKYGLVAGASIGFRAMKDGAEMMDSGGIRFKSVEVLEMSLVTVPANQDCTISLVKSLDRKSLAAIGNKRSAVILASPGAAGIGTSRTFAEGKQMKSISEQITALEATRVAKTARMATIMQTPMEEGRSSDAAEGEEFDTIEAEVAALDVDLKRLRTMEKMAATTARPVEGYSAGNSAAAARIPAQAVRTKSDLPPGIGFAQVVKCIASGRGNLLQSVEMAKHMHGEQSDVTMSLKGLARIGTSNNLELIERAAVQGATTTDSDWAGPLVFPFPRLASEFLDFLRPRTVLGRITGMTQIPFNVNIASQTSGSTAGWVGEGKAKPVTSFGFSSVNFRWAKVAAILVQSEELMRFSSPSSDALFRDELVRAIAERQDLDFLDPANAGTANIKPASVTNGVSPTVSTGNDADHVRKDLENLLATFDAVNLSLTNPYFIMSQTKARALALMRTPLGTREFPDVNLMGDGSVEGIPIISSQYVTRFGTTGGEYVILLNAPDIWFADDGQVTVDASREASLQMDDTPSEDESGGTGASMVSMFQTNSVALRAERYVNWQKRRAQAVAVLGNVFWGHAAVSGT